MRNMQLTNAREQMGWNYQDVADRIGVEARRVHAWEMGTETPSERDRKKLCKLFDLDMSKLGFLARERAVTGNSRLYQARKRRGWTRKEVADLIGVLPDQILAWERGTEEPSTADKGKLCDLFDLDIDKLGFLKPQRNKDKGKRNSSSSVMNIRNRTGGRSRDIRRGS